MILAATQAAATGAAPWWGTPLIAGLFAIGGVLATIIFNAVRDQREKKRRFEQVMREAAARFLSTTGRLVDLYSWERPASWQLDPKEGVAAYQVALDAYSELELVGPKNVVAEAYKLLSKAGKVQSIAQDDPNFQKHWEVEHEYWKSRRDFSNAVRHYFGLGPSEPPQLTEA